MWLGNGEWVCWLLNNLQKLQFNVFQDKNLCGFGLLQLDCDFFYYQDVMGWYNKCFSLWVELCNQWGKGVVSLMEILIIGEMLDNIVCFWQLEKVVKVGDELDFCYCFYWSVQLLVSILLVCVLVICIGMGGFFEGWVLGEYYLDKWVCCFVIDFVGGDLKVVVLCGIELVIIFFSGEVKQIEIFYVELFDGYWIFFDWYLIIDLIDLVEMCLFLCCQGEVISEIWFYQYFLLVVDKCNYVDDWIMK